MNQSTPTLRVLCAFALSLLAAGCAHDFRVERGQVYARPDGKALRMNLYSAKGASDSARPGMVLVHGGGWIAGRRTQQGWWARNFAREGYVVLACDYRKLPLYPFPACVEDAKSAVRWLRLHAEALGVDPERIVTFGASAGGHIAGMLAATQPEDGFEGSENPGPSTEVSAAVLLYPAVDLTSYRDGDVGRAGVRLLGRFVEPNFSAAAPSERYEDAFEWASPISYIHADMPPVYLIHGTRDGLVPFVQSERFLAALQDKGIPSVLSPQENRNHGFDFLFWRERRAAFEEALAWLRALPESGAEHGTH